MNLFIKRLIWSVQNNFLKLQMNEVLIGDVPKDSDNTIFFD